MRFMLALYHLYVGKVDPVKLSSQWNFSPRPVPSRKASQRFSPRLDAGEIRGAFDSARPSARLVSARPRAAEGIPAIAAAGGWPHDPDGPTLKPGMSDPRVPVLRNASRVDAGPACRRRAPPTPPIRVSTTRRSSTASRHFQERHGLTADGAVGPGTRAALNVPVGARIDQIRVNLERGRWVLHEIQGDFVLVDVAGFYVSYFRDDEPVWTSRVVVGRP